MSKKLVKFIPLLHRKLHPSGEYYLYGNMGVMVLELDNLIEYWGNKQLTPMLLVDERNHISWCNRWAGWLFRLNPRNNNLRQLPAGNILADFAERVRKNSDPPLINISINGVSLDIEGRMMGEDNSGQLMILKFHTHYLSRASMLEMHKFMQDFALETGDRVNNPLTVVQNCLHLIDRDIRRGNFDKVQTYLELAIREANVMKEFGDWVRRLSEESPTQETFNLIPVLEEVLDRRDCLKCLKVLGEIPLIKGCAEHAALVLGGLVNLIRQASGNKAFTISVAPRDRRLVIVEINANQTQVKDLRMLSEEFYGGLGLLAARYLLALMQAQLEMEFMSDVGIRVTFVIANPFAENINAG